MAPSSRVACADGCRARRCAVEYGSVRAEARRWWWRALTRVVGAVGGGCPRGVVGATLIVARGFARKLSPQTKNKMKNFGNFFAGRDKANYSTTDSFKLLFKAWKIIATISDKQTGLSLIYHVLLFRLCVLISPVAFMVGTLEGLSYLPFMEVLSNLQASFNTVTLPIKAFVIAINAERLRSVDEIFMRLDQRYQLPGEYAKIRDCVVTCRRFFSIYYVMYWMYAILTYILALLSNKLPLNLWLPFLDLIPYTNLRYILSFLFQIFYTMILTQNQVNNDSYSAIYMRAIRTHINLLSDRVLRLGTNPESSEEETRKELLDIVISHKELLDVAQRVRAIVSLTMFAQFTVAAIILCICMLNILVFANSGYQLVTVTYYLCVMMQTVPTCYQASMLEADCEKLPIAIFHCNWLALDKHTRKLIPYFMQRAQEGITFTAFKLFKIDLTTNLSIAKFSFTLYTCFTTLGIGDKIKQRFQ
ncbi:odorant receptor 43b-like [Eurosta solidaginis]|uniref:odorant receptor 43b-like n=1 Tax=Eurosta solidaginis TaxID=178769 RepID=UPI003530575C